MLNKRRIQKTKRINAKIEKILKKCLFISKQMLSGVKTVQACFVCVVAVAADRGRSFFSAFYFTITSKSRKPLSSVGSELRQGLLQRLPNKQTLFQSFFGLSCQCFCFLCRPLVFRLLLSLYHRQKRLQKSVVLWSEIHPGLVLSDHDILARDIPVPHIKSPSQAHRAKHCATWGCFSR